MKINDEIQRFKKVKEDTLTSIEHYVQTWTNKDFELIIETKVVSQSDETWQHKGSLTLKSRKGEMVEQKVYGECGC